MVKKEKREKGEKEKIPVRKPREMAIWRPYEIWEDIDRSFKEFRRDMEDRFLRPWLKRWPIVPEVMEPFADLIDAGKEFKVVVELPGIPKEKVDVSVTPDEIDIKGEVNQEVKEEREGYVRRERKYSAFHRRISFPEEVLPDGAEAKLRDGILEVIVPKKKPTPKGRKVPVR
jgi:HSP20 family protein